LQLGRYQILKQLTTGDVADVLLARANGLEGFARHVVIKCIRKELAREERLVESFLEEARIAAALHHQNIVQVHDIGEQDGAYFFAMEYVHGEDVRRLLGKARERGEQVPLAHVIAIISATAAGLHHAHEQRSPTGQPLGVVHRDICPANILLGYDGSVKLGDFGMARAAQRSVKTASGSLKGKASYMSPEQCMGKTVDRRTDTFALGIVLYELLTAQRLFKGANEFLTMAAIVEGDVPPPSTLRPEITRDLDEIVMRALARAPEARYQTAEDLRAALERFAIEHELRASNKALADYFTALFGARIEPWQADAGPVPAQQSDDTHGKGLVAAPDDRKGAIAKHAPRATSPIMMAQTWADEESAVAAPPTQPSAQPVSAAPVSTVDDEWSKGIDAVATTVKKPSQQMAAQLGLPVAERNVDQEATRNERRPSAAISVATIATPAAPVVAAAAPAVVVPPRGKGSATEDPFTSTLVAPPVFVDEDPTISVDDQNKTTGASGNADDPGDEDAATLTGDNMSRMSADTTTGVATIKAASESTNTLTGSDLEIVSESSISQVMDPPPLGRPLSEGMYVGPPARGKVRVALAERWQQLGRFFGTYKQSILVGAGSGLVVVVIGALLMRGCGK
jgi:serine/threonine protein kinase